MKNLFFILMFSGVTLLNQFSFAQNLVPNSSFEDTIACPIGTGAISYSTGWTSYCQTPEYYNLCNIGVVSIPSNIFGYQPARTGNAYAGLFTFHSATQYREFIGVQLTQPLIVGRAYSAKFYTSFSFGITQHNNIATNKLGIRFSTVPFSSFSPAPIDNYSQVYTDSVITDTMNWVEISGSFIADSGYQYVSIGNFFTDTNTTQIRFDSSAATSYYYVDDLNVHEIDSSAEEINIISNISLVKIFPNPTHDWLFLEGSGIMSYSIFDISGRKCFESIIQNNNLIKIDVHNFSRGPYLIHIKTSKKSFFNKIFIQ